jgi:hypothetical protein
MHHKYAFFLEDLIRGSSAKMESAFWPRSCLYLGVSLYLSRNCDPGYQWRLATIAPITRHSDTERKRIVSGTTSLAVSDFARNRSYVPGSYQPLPYAVSSLGLSTYVVEVPRQSTSYMGKQMFLACFIDRGFSLIIKKCLHAAFCWTPQLGCQWAEFGSRFSAQPILRAEHFSSTQIHKTQLVARL